MAWLRAREFLILAKKNSPSFIATCFKISLHFYFPNGIEFYNFYLILHKELLWNFAWLLRKRNSNHCSATNKKYSFSQYRHWNRFGLREKKKALWRKNFQKIWWSKKNGNTKSEQRNNYVNLENSKSLFILHFPCQIHKSVFGLTLLWAKICLRLSRYNDSSQWSWNIIYVTSPPAQRFTKKVNLSGEYQKYFFCETYYS